MTLNEIIARGPPRFPSTQRMVKLERFVAYVKAAVPDTSVATTQLLRMMGVPQELSKPACSWLYIARVEGMLHGYFTVGAPSAFTYGKPSYRWHKPKDVLPWQQD